MRFWPHIQNQVQIQFQILIFNLILFRIYIRSQLTFWLYIGIQNILEC